MKWMCVSACGAVVATAAWLGFMTLLADRYEHLNAAFSRGSISSVHAMPTAREPHEACGSVRAA